MDFNEKREPVFYSVLRLFCFLETEVKHIAPIAVTRSSVAGNAHHTPWMFQKCDSKKAIGMIIRKPRRRESIWAGRGFSKEVKYMEMITLNPAKGQAVK